MEVIAIPEPAGGGALDDVRALFQLQSHALKAAQEQADASQVRSQAQIDALQQQIDALRRGSHDTGDARPTASPVSQSHDLARAATVAAIAQLDAKTKKDTFDLQVWWCEAASKIPSWATMLRAVLTNSPNSIPPERCFSILNDSFDDDQSRSNADYIELSIEKQYNARGRGGA